MRKRCPKCGETKSEAEYKRSKTSALSSYCNPCGVEYRRNHYRANKERYRERNRRWREAHPNEAREAALRWQRINSARKSEVASRWYKANAEKVKEATKRWQTAAKAKDPQVWGKARSRKLYGEFWEAHRALIDLKKTIKKEAA